MGKVIKPGIYRHFKGKKYKVIGVCHHSETLEKFVVYQALYDSEEFGPRSLWVRPYELFIETVEQNGKEVLRFEFVREKE